MLGTLWEWYDMEEHVIAANVPNVQGEIFEVGGGANLGFLIYGTHTDELITTVGGVSTD